MIELELGVEHRVEVAAHALTVGKGDRFLGPALVRAPSRRQAIEGDPEHPSDRLTPQLDVEDLQPVAASHATGDRPDLVEMILSPHAH